MWKFYLNLIGNLRLTSKLCFLSKLWFSCGLLQTKASTHPQLHELKIKLKVAHKKPARDLSRCSSRSRPGSRRRSSRRAYSPRSWSTPGTDRPSYRECCRRNLAPGGGGSHDDRVWVPICSSCLMTTTMMMNLNVMTMMTGEKDRKLC